MLIENTETERVTFQIIVQKNEGAEPHLTCDVMRNGWINGTIN